MAESATEFRDCLTKDFCSDRWLLEGRGFQPAFNACNNASGLDFSNGIEQKKKRKEIGNYKILRIFMNLFGEINFYRELKVANYNCENFGYIYTN